MIFIQVYNQFYAQINPIKANKRGQTWRVKKRTWD